MTKNELTKKNDPETRPPEKSSRSLRPRRLVPKIKHKKFLIGILLLAVIVFTLIRFAAGGEGVAFRTFTTSEGKKTYKDSFSHQDAVGVEISFKNPKAKNYAIDIIRTKQEKAPFRIEIPAAKAGETRVVTLPKQLLVGDSVTLTLRDASLKDTIQKETVHFR